jgi:hypothetical protein
MAIDKIYPSKMDKDKSPFLFEKGDVIDVFNMSLADYGGSSGGTLKPVKGNNYALYTAGSNPGGARTVIGSVADVSKDRVYFFVKGSSQSNSGIYLYNNVTNQVTKVLVSAVLNFQNVNFVKADVVNADFRQDGTVTSMLYFTDGVNEPRRINIDRALSGEYNSYSSTDLGLMLSVCKAASVNVPKFFFDTDTSIRSNNLHGKAFQFAVQYLYNDGEESAISPYSRIAYTDYTAVETVESSGSKFYEDNVCVIDVSRENYSSVVATQSLLSDIETVSKIRLLGRNGNDGAFFVIDEFNPDTALVRHVFGVLVNVYDPTIKKYRFYNDGLYAPVSQDDVNKLYDNVPFTAVGQCIAGNRLMYSNYTEGRDNVDTSAAVINVTYSSSTSTGDINNVNATSTVVTKVNGQNQVKVDLLAQNGFLDANVIIPSGSITNLSFKFNPSCSITHANWQTDPLYYYDLMSTQGDVFKAYMASQTQTFAKRASEQDQYVYISIYANQDLTVAQLREKIQEEISSKRIVIKSDVSNTSDYKLVGAPLSYGDGQIVRVLEGYDYYEVEWSLDDIINASGGEFTIKPYISNIVSKKPYPNADKRTFEYVTPYAPPGSGTFVTQFTATVTGQFFKTLTTQTYVTYNNFTVVVDPDTFSSVGLETTQSFKAGCTHEIGVVYYDKYNRSGNVNVIGSFYSLPFGHPSRSGKNGATSISVNFGGGGVNPTVQAPSWASRYQIVYAGPSTYESFVSYTTGGAYAKRVSGGSVDAVNKSIYVSLKTLEKYMSEKSALRNYSFTPGDKLRVISYDSGTSTAITTYPTALVKSGATYVTSNDPIEFNIIGFEVLSDTNNPIAPSGETTNEKYHGDFVILEAPETMTNPPQKKFIGWDWYQLTGTAYEGEGVPPTQTNYWGRRSVVELLTPRKETSEKIYYEIGDSYEFVVRGNDILHGSNSTNQGDVHIRSTPCKTAVYGSDWTTVGSPSAWKYLNVPLESNNISDIKNLSHWSRGRAHVKYDKSRTKYEKNGIIYSDAYEQDVLKNSLSSFNPSLANFSYVDRTYGALNYIASLGENLVAIQENKTSMAGVDRNVISYADAQDSVAVSTNVIGPFRYLSGDYGCGSLQEGVLKLNNQLFFVDPDKRKVIRFSADQTYIISENGMTNYFDPKLILSCKSGYDPAEDMYYLTINGDDTLGYSLSDSNWISRYFFKPDRYDTIGSSMISFKSNASNYMAWRHDGESTSQRCLFYGASAGSNNAIADGIYFGLTAASAISPSDIKVFNSMSVEGKNKRKPFEKVDGANNVSYTLSLSTDLGHVSPIGETPSYREGNWFYEIKKSKRSGNINSLSPYLIEDNVNVYISTSNIVWLGARNLSITPIETIDSGVYYTRVWFDNRISDLPVKINDRLYFVTSSNNEMTNPDPVACLLTTIHDDGSLTFSSTASILSSVGAQNQARLFGLVDMINHYTKGEDPRGHYATVELYGKGPSSEASVEVYCLNLSVSESLLHHSSSENA